MYFVFSLHWHVWVKTTIFVPYTGWIGLVLIAVCALISAYTGVILGRCWVIIKDRFPDKYAKDHIRYPYPAIGFEAAGIYAR